MSAENAIEITTRSENANAVETPSAIVTTTTTTTAVAPAAAATIPIIVMEPATANAVTTTLDTKITETKANGENNGNAPPLEKPMQQQSSEQLQQQQQNQSSTAPESKAKMDGDDASFANFKVLYVLTQLCGLTMVVLVGCWVGVHMGGLGGTSNLKQEFNWHPLFMTIGLIFLYGNSILVYRGFRSTRKKTLKLTHAAIHMAAFILTVIALKTVFDTHNLATPPIPNMYSLHSWLGLSAVLIFSMQYVCGFVAYLLPGLRESYKIALMPLHIYFGLFGFVLAIASALMGLTEKIIFSVNEFSTLPPAGLMANMCGVLYVIFGGLVVYLVSEPAYKRKPIPEDAVLLTGVSE